MVGNNIQSEQLYFTSCIFNSLPTVALIVLPPYKQLCVQNWGSSYMKYHIVESHVSLSDTY